VRSAPEHDVTTLALRSLTVPAPTVSYPLSLHDALPIWSERRREDHHHGVHRGAARARCRHDFSARYRSFPRSLPPATEDRRPVRSEEHTSELQSRENLVCRLLLEKKKKGIQHV